MTSSTQFSMVCYFNAWVIRLFRLMALTFLACGCFAHAQTKSVSSRVRTNFDMGWSFFGGDVTGAEQKSFDDKSWRRLDLPHDMSVESVFMPKHEVGAPGGYLPGGVGWYRKSFKLPADIQSRKVSIEFDGAYMNSEVWINGHHLGKRPYGYIGFVYDLTPHLDLAGVNVVVVKVDNMNVPSGRWYTGTGIYRHVWLNQTDPLHVDHWGTYVTTPSVTEQKATVRVETTIVNERKLSSSVMVKQSVLSSDGAVVASVNTKTDLAVGEKSVIPQELVVENPKLWSPDSPTLYTVRTELFEGDRLVDRYDSTLGLREFHFDANKGLILNGKSIKMKGVCNHQDLGPLGTALWDQALERRIKLLKEMGCNAIRTSHYPQSTELLAMCDRYGILVSDETFDEWRRGWDFEGQLLVSSKRNKGKAKYGYHLYLDEWAERDLTDHLKRDRNHPSVIMWSIGNEVPEAQKNGEIDTVKKFRDLCHQIDPTRPVTVGCNQITGANAIGFAQELDVVGYNEGGNSVFEYEKDHALYPDRKIYASEVPHSLQTRGEYRSRPRYYRKGFDHKTLTETEVFPETNEYYESSYDNAGVQIEARHSWRLTKSLPYIAGEFRWTGFDYIGESGGWPRALGNFGVIDLCNFPKDTFYFYQSQWTEKPMVHLLPHWTWPGKEGVGIPVWCYTNCDDAELFLNGKSLGKKSFDKINDMHLEWLVPYQVGELKVVANKDGKVAATSVVRTAGLPKAVVLSPDKMELDPRSRDLSYVTIRVDDAVGNFVPRASNWVNIQIDGPGRIVGSGNGDPLNHESFQANTLQVFNGLALVIISPTTGPEPEIRKDSDRKPGEIIVKANVKGMEPIEVRLKRTHEGNQASGSGTASDGGEREIDQVDGLPTAK